MFQEMLSWTDHANAGSSPAVTIAKEKLEAGVPVSKIYQEVFSNNTYEKLMNLFQNGLAGLEHGKLDERMRLISARVSLQGRTPDEFLNMINIFLQHHNPLDSITTLAVLENLSHQAARPGVLTQPLTQDHVRRISEIIRASNIDKLKNVQIKKLESDKNLTSYTDKALKIIKNTFPNQTAQAQTPSQQQEEEKGSPRIMPGGGNTLNNTDESAFANFIEQQNPHASSRQNAQGSDIEYGFDGEELKTNFEMQKKAERMQSTQAQLENTGSGQNPQAESDFDTKHNSNGEKIEKRNATQKKQWQ